MEQDSNGGSDAGRDYARDLGDEPAPAIRDSAPDFLAPIDADAPVSGHNPPPEPTSSPAESPEQDWSRARDLIYPAFRPVGTQGLDIEAIDRDSLAAHSQQSHAQPLLDVGPAELPVVYTIDAGAYDIVVNGDHLLSWGVEPSDIQDAAMSNLFNWSATAPWTDEVSGDRRLISSDTGNGWDAVRMWRRWRHSRDTEALELLLAYNEADCVNLLPLADLLYCQLVQQCRPEIELPQFAVHKS